MRTGIKQKPKCSKRGYILWSLLALSFFGFDYIVNVIIMLYICNHKRNIYADNDKQNTDSLPV